MAIKYKVGKKEIDINMKKDRADRIVKSAIEWEDLTLEKNYRKIANKILAEDEKILTQKNQEHIKELTITIEWKKSQTWGYNPKANVEIHYKKGTFEIREGFTCSGCGYDKESTVIAQIFNDTLKYKLWELEGKDIDKEKIPYGIRLDFEFNPSFSGGIGTNCYYKISEFIGGKFERLASGKTFDVYKFTMVD